MGRSSFPGHEYPQTCSNRLSQSHLSCQHTMNKNCALIEAACRAAIHGSHKEYVRGKDTPNGGDQAKRGDQSLHKASTHVNCHPCQRS